MLWARLQKYGEYQEPSAHCRHVCKGPHHSAGLLRGHHPEELNAKKIAFTEDVSAFTSYSFKPQMRTVGPKYGKLLNKIRQILPKLDGNAAMNELRAKGELKLDIDGESIVLLEEDLLIETAQTEGFVSEQDNEITVVLDTNLTEELIEEGFVREIISRFRPCARKQGLRLRTGLRFMQRTMTGF